MLPAMRAVVFERNGGPEVLSYAACPGSGSGDGQVLVDVEAAGVNYRDVYEREGGGYGSPPPAIIGVEGAGTIAGTGERVAWVAVPGSYAEHVVADRRRLVPIPDDVSCEVAAAALLQGMTAHYLAADSYPVREGDWVVVHAAAGGVGLLLTQIAKLRGGRIIATTSTEEKAALAREAGADEVIGYDGFAEQVRELTGGEGAAADLRRHRPDHVPRRARGAPAAREHDPVRRGQRTAGPAQAPGTRRRWLAVRPAADAQTRIPAPPSCSASGLPRSLA